MSGPRASIYIFGITVTALLAFYVDAEAKEIALWEAAFGAAIPVGALALAAVKTWPRRSKGGADD